MKKIKQMEPIEDSKLPLVIPEMHYLSARYVISLPANDEHFKNRWQLRLYAEKLLEQDLGDQVQLTSLKVRKPHLVSKSVARLRHQIPNAKMHVTVKF